MSRIGFIVLYAPGHINPSLTLARALANAGHEIVFFNLLDIAPAVPDDLRFVSFAEAEFPSGSLRISMKTIGELSGPPAMAFYIERMTTLLQASFKNLPDLITRESLNLLVIDQLFPGASTIADHLHLPFVSLANALHVNREPTIPPPLFTWPYDPSPAGIERNAKGWAGVAHFFSPLLALVNTQRSAWNLPPYADFLEDSFSPLAQISRRRQPSISLVPKAPQRFTASAIFPPPPPRSPHPSRGNGWTPVQSRARLSMPPSEPCKTASPPSFARSSTPAPHSMRRPS